MGLLRRPTTGEIVEDGRLGRPCGPGALRAQLEKTSLRLRRHSHISDISPVATYRDLMERDANFLEAIIVGNDPWWFGVPGRCLHPSSGDRRRRQYGIRSPLHSHGRPPGPPCGGRSALGLVPQLAGWRARPLAAGPQPQVLVGVLAAWAARVVMDRTQLPPSVEDDPGEVTGSPRPELLWTKLVAPAPRAGLASPGRPPVAAPIQLAGQAVPGRCAGRVGQDDPARPMAGRGRWRPGGLGVAGGARQRPHPVLELSGGGVADRRAGGGHRGP